MLTEYVGRRRAKPRHLGITVAFTVQYEYSVFIGSSSLGGCCGISSNLYVAMCISAAGASHLVSRSPARHLCSSTMAPEKGEYSDDSRAQERS